MGFQGGMNQQKGDVDTVWDGVTVCASGAWQGLNAALPVVQLPALLRGKGQREQVQEGGRRGARAIGHVRTCPAAQQGGAAGGPGESARGMDGMVCLLDGLCPFCGRPWGRCQCRQGKRGRRRC